MSIRWKLDYGIEWSKDRKKRPCPDCNWTGAETFGMRTDQNGFLKLRTMRCTRCGCCYSTIECDVERFVDLLDTEQTVERAMKIEAAMRQIVGVVQSTLDSEEKK